jgi:hypothetical protein
LLLLIGCAQLIGLEEREFSGMDGGAPMIDGAIDAPSADGGPGDAGELSCDRYCALALDRCKVEQKVQLFASEARCKAVCAAYPPGDRSNPTGNTLACRIAQLEKLAPGDTLEAPTYCPGAGPGGSASEGEGDNAACGSNCVGFCRLRQHVCINEQAELECVRKCQALHDDGTYNAGADFGGGADSIQCRLAHLSAAAEYGRQAVLENNPKLLEDRNNHCAHSNIKSSMQCDLKTDMAPDCTDFCNIATTACASSDVKVYDSPEQCVSVCNRLAAGTKATIMENNRRCRRERAYDALQLGANPVFCEAAGPAPPLCGAGKCSNYCELARAACQTTFDAKFSGATAEERLAKCRTDCDMIPDSKQTSFYSVSQATGDTFNCRLRHTALAFLDPRTCDSAVASSAPMSTNVCKN